MSHLRRLTELGLVKLVNEVDMKEAARAGLLGLGSKPLTSDNIEKHLTDFGLDPEFGVHSRIRGLSGTLYFPPSPHPPHLTRIHVLPIHDMVLIGSLHAFCQGVLS